MEVSMDAEKREQAPSSPVSGPRARHLEQVLRKLRSESPGIDRYASRTGALRRVELLPGVWNDDPRTWVLLARLYKELTEQFPPSPKDEQGRLLAPGIAGDWSSLLTIPYAPPSPEFVPPRDNSRLIEVEPRMKGLNREETRLTRTVCNFLVKLFTPDEVVPIFYQPADTNGGAPDNSPSRAVKFQDMATWRHNARDILSLINTHQLSKLWADYHMLFLWLIGRRYQADGATIDPDTHRIVPKRRFGFDWLDNPRETDKDASSRFPTLQRTLIQAGLPPWLTLNLARSRSLQIGPRKIAHGQKGFVDCQRKAVKRRAAFAFRHTTKQQIESKVAGCVKLFCFDITNHDQLMTYWLRDHYLRTWDGIPSVQELMRLLYRAPSLALNDYPGHSGCILQGDPFNAADFTADYVNTTGDDKTDRLAGFAGAFYILHACALSGGMRTPYDDSEYLDILQGRHPVFVVLVAGDNVVLGLRQDVPGVADAILNYREVVWFNRVHSFLGYSFVWTGSGWRLVENPLSYAGNIVQPIRHANDPQRGNFGKGYFARKENHYYRNLTCIEVDAVMNRVWESVWGESLIDYANRVIAEDRKPPDPRWDLPDLTQAEQDYILNPATRHYRHEDEDIRPEIMIAHEIPVTDWLDWAWPTDVRDWIMRHPARAV